LPLRGDRARDPETVSWMQRTVMATLDVYKVVVSPLLPSACRFHPTCSEYMREAVARHGVLRGGWLGIRRLAKCHPFHSGGVDHVPDVPERVE
jgi:putative membrane protein insertion efficiency factor